MEGKEGKITPEEAKKMVEEMRDELFARAEEHLPITDMPRIKAAYEMAEKAHASQVRKSGIPYITHPISVARIALVELGLGTNSIIAALLHDVVEDTDYTIEDIRAAFGEDVAFLVGVLTKNDNGNYKVSKQIDNFKQMLDSIQYDIRALLIKLSDRMHNLRTLGSMRTDKQMKIASETDYFYAPLANRLGLYDIKSELENLSLKFRSPHEYERIEKKINSYMKLHQQDIEDFLTPVRETLADEGIKARVYARPRSVYALWCKMQSSGQTFKELEHVHQVNIIIEGDPERGSEKNQCLQIYSLLTDLYKERPYSMINYIDQPKENGYQAIHVEVMTHTGGWAEVHICTESMYRNSQQGCVIDRTESIDKWVLKFKAVLKDIAQGGAEGFMENVVSSFYNDDIIVFTPKGHSIVLPKDSTVLDMAYEIHTNVGNHAKFARINGKLSSVFSTLNRGDRVEIGTDDMTWPEAHWLKHVNTYKARRAVNVSLSKSGISTEEFPFILCEECNPLPGDEIAGFKQKDGTIIVHKRNCPVAIQLSAKEGDSIVDVTLPVLPNRTYPTQIVINSVDRNGLLLDLVNVISNELHLGIDALHTETVDYIVTTRVRVQVPSAFELMEAMRIIEQVKGVEEVRTI
ncbi:MAG: bifunctional (p)ppGpp synthetase/guanosine-3',5'-bis(diphosphate) 3'-pyrophosphohydrolase [Bacteroidales bacterium]|jgi:GTP pyrophosphokinase|nr:bifunctional (p)ppGpp synthetase/guanosine-3',5'-bis(diphosphate) 3'-pyrophosphohydrolase [Bacteroidales bacterium]